MTSINVSGFTVSTHEYYEWHDVNFIGWTNTNILEFDRKITVGPANWPDTGTGKIVFSSENDAKYTWSDGTYSGT